MAGWHELLTPEGREILAAATQLSAAGLTPQATQNTLRKRYTNTALIAASMSQLELRQKAVRKFGKIAHQLFFTPAALEQASRKQVSKLHAKRLRHLNVTTVYDLGCGIGAESLAFLRAGLRVIAYEIDPLTASYARENLRIALELLRAKHPERHYPEPEVRCADAHSFTAVQILDNPNTKTVPVTSAASAIHTAVFFDPARRTAGHRNTTRVQPADYSPHLDFIFAVADKLPTLVKLGPGFQRDLIPESAAAEWVSVNGEAVETLLTFTPLPPPTLHNAKHPPVAGSRRATVIRKHSGADDTWRRSSLYAETDYPDATLAPLGNYLYEPDPAVIRARQIGQLARLLAAGQLSESIAYLTGNQLHHTDLAQCFRVLACVSLREKAVSGKLRELGATAVEIKKRGVDIDPAQFRKKLGLQAAKGLPAKQLTVVLTRVDGAHQALICERV